MNKQFTFLKVVSMLLMGMFLSFSGFSQVTTSSIIGFVKDGQKEVMPGAVITATHKPSGSIYKTASRADGSFTLPGLRIGGPYQVKIDFVGSKTAYFENIYLELGEPFSINAVLVEDNTTLDEVLVKGQSRTVTDKNGVSTVLNNRVLTSMPTISRSISDFTRLTPQANGNSFGGRDSKLNNITIDGANLNNNFGLNSDPLPGSGNSPVSLDAFEEVSVNISPYDVKQGNFTGGNIAAITKSGTNEFKGTAYTYFRNNEKHIGDKVKGTEVNRAAGKTTIYGGSVGGPIIKNKLFFFVNAEFENKPPQAGITWVPTGGSGAGNVSTVLASDLQKVSDFVKAKGYDPGVYDNFSAFKNETQKFLAKLDWNINNAHKLSFKYSDFKGTQDFQPSQSGNIGGTQAGVTYGPKFSESAMSFSGSTYAARDIVRSGALELNSMFNSRLSNQFIATMTKITSDKTRSGSLFPFVDILKDGRNYISVGNEPFNGNNNSVINDIFTITNNLTYYAGQHTLTGGLSYEYQKVGNMFMRGSSGYYVFSSLDDFLNNNAPMKYSQTYSLIPGQDAVYSAELKIGQLAAYIQDEINFNSRFKVTAGLRLDLPIYPEQPLENQANSALSFLDRDGNALKLSTGHFPKASPLFSPRVGFRYDLKEDRSLVLRGGTGIFTGRIPFVYLTNIPTNSGMYQYSSNVNTGLSDVNMNDYKFNPDPNAYNPMYNNSLPSKYFPTTAGTTASADFAVTAKNFKFPQVWRSNLGLDYNLKDGWKVSLEAMFTKDINATAMFNANQTIPTSTVTTGDFTRPAFSANNNAARRENPGITNAIVLDNTKQGRSYVLTAQVSKGFSNGLFGSVAYNYTNAKDVTANPGSQASSIWNANPTSNNLNSLELSHSAFATPHRVIANVSYKKEYVKHMATTISLFYEGSNPGRYSYIYNGDINFDGYAQDLMYVPTDARDVNQIKFVDKVIGGVTYTAQEQGELFEKYISQDPYLKTKRGEVVERFGALTPWYNRFDAKLLQDFYITVKGKKHTLQFSADVLNVANLISNKWGVRKLYTLQNPLRVESVTNGVPSFSIAPFNNAPVSQTFVDNVSTASTWSAQFGLRYIFN